MQVGEEVAQLHIFFFYYERCFNLREEIILQNILQLLQTCYF